MSINSIENLHVKLAAAAYAVKAQCIIGFTSKQMRDELTLIGAELSSLHAQSAYPVDAKYASALHVIADDLINELKHKSSVALALLSPQAKQADKEAITKASQGFFASFGAKAQPTEALMPVPPAVVTRGGMKAR